jgi:excisionase family DNA binding protein
VAKPRANPRLAKIHRNYTVEEIATLYGVHRNTVRQWIKAGLPVVDQRRPVLVLGAALADFLRKRRTVNKRPCRPGEIYCVRCREPRLPAGGDVRYHPITPTQGNLVGLCPSCSAGLFRRVSAANLGQFDGVLRITLPPAGEHISKSTQPSVDSDFKQDDQDHANAQR